MVCGLTSDYYLRQLQSSMAYSSAKSEPNVSVPISHSGARPTLATVSEAASMAESKAAAVRIKRREDLVNL